MPYRRFIPDIILFDVVWTLSGNGRTPGQYLHRWTEPCAHTPEQTMEVLARLEGMSSPALVEFASKVAKTKNVRRRLWGGAAKCELCRKLELIAEDSVTPVDATDSMGTCSGMSRGSVGLAARK